jgi:hypothetical protein
MADDGSGSDISIPPFLMFQRDVKVKANRPVQIEMKWNSDMVARDFMKDFGKIAEALGDRACVTPHTYIYDGIKLKKSHCQGNSGENYCSILCTNNGRRCATDSEHDLEQGISGADVVNEIWKMNWISKGIGKEWWSYVATFNDRLRLDHISDNCNACIKDIYKVSKIDGKVVERCMDDSGGVEKDQSKAKLDFEILSLQQTFIVVLPTAFVNVATIGGAWTVKTIYSAICAGLEAVTKPSVCSRCALCGDAVTCVETERYTSSESGGGVSMKFFASSMFIVVGAFAALGVWHNKRIRDEMREQEARVARILHDRDFPTDGAMI